MPKGVYIRTKQAWNKGIKTGRIPWNKGMKYTDEQKDIIRIAVSKSEKYIKHRSTLTHRTKEHIKMKRDEYKSKNRERVKKWKRDDYLRSRDRYIYRAKKHYVEHCEAKKAYSRKYQQDNIVKVIKRIAEWERRNPEKKKAYSENRRAQKKIGGGKISAQDIKTQYLIQGGLCYWCERPVNENYHLDHLIPLSRGGLHSVNNIVISCPKCNVTKNNKTPEEFRKFKETINNALLNKP